MKIALVGGGITGLTAAYLLSKKGHQVSVFEKEKVLGGLASSFKTNDWAWSLERFYHHFFSSDKETLRLLRGLGINNKLFFKKPQTSVFVDNQIYPFDNLQNILAFPKLTLSDKLRTFLMAGLMKINPFWEPLEKITAYSFIEKTIGKRNFNLIWKPLLDSKFAEFAPQVPASWFWTRIQKRSFKLGYLEGGIETLISKLTEKIKKNGGEILLNQEVDKIEKDNEKFDVYADQKKYPENFDKTIVSTSPQTLAKIFPQFNLKEKEWLGKLKSLGSICLVMELRESFLTEGTYWLNINDSRFPFVAVVEHTNFIDKKYYNNHHLLYIGGYYPHLHRYFKMKKEDILNEFLPFLKKINPAFDPLFIIHYSLFISLYAQPIPSLNYSKNLPSINTNINGLFWGSLHHVYPQDRGVNYAILLGKRIANEVSSS